MKYKKVPNNKNAIMIDGKVVMSFDPRYKEYLKWKDENLDLEKQLVDDLELDIRNKELYNGGAPHKTDNLYRWYRKNGILGLSCEMKNGEPEGLWIKYYENGHKMEEKTLKNGKEQGLFNQWYDNGQLVLSCEMKDGKRHGVERGFYDNGDVRSVIHYKNGKRHGKLESYHQSVRKSKELKETDRNGDEVKADTFQEGTYENIVHEKTSWFFIEPDKKVKETVEKTSWFFIEPDKDLLSRNNRIETWKDGKPYGEYIDYHLNSKERAKGNMLYGMMEGKWTFWYHNGNKELECEFDFGNLVGSAKIYHDNGLLKKQVSF